MEKSKIIKIGLISVLIYLAFIKTINILSELLIWLNLELRIENHTLLYLLTFILGIISLLLLNFLFNHYLKKGVIKTKSIYELLALSILLTLVMGGINYLYAKYTADIEMAEFRFHYLYNVGWFRSLDMVFPILGLIMFLWKMKMTD